MDSPRCPHLDQFARDLVEAYRRRAEERDLFGLLVGRVILNDIEVAHLAMAQHRRECPLCREADSATQAIINALQETSQPVPQAVH